MKNTLSSIMQAKEEGRKITMLTAYDYLTAKIIDQAGTDMILVGDSLGFVQQGMDTTIPVTVDEMIYHSKMVVKGVENAMVVTDMPFGSYETGARDALKNAIRIVKESGCNAVKLEGGKKVVNAVKAINNAGIPIMGHLGLTPQSVNKLGMKAQARSEYEVRRLISDAIALEAAGTFSIVLEAIPIEAARRVTEAVKIPTIGIGAGINCDGQVLVSSDIFNLTGLTAKFVKVYGDVKSVMENAVSQFISEVQQETYPSIEYSYDIQIKENEEISVLERMNDYKVVNEFEELNE